MVCYCLHFQKQLFADVFQIEVFKKFTIFTEKHLCLSILLIKLQACKSKKIPTQMFSCKYCKLFKNSFFYRTHLVTAMYPIHHLQKQPPEVFSRKGVPRNFAKFTGKHLCQGLFFHKVAGLRPATLLKKGLWYRCFPVNFLKFLRTCF